MIFFCSGCRYPCLDVLCPACRESFYWNTRILPSNHTGIEGIAPLLYGFERTQRIIRRWKEHGGSALESRLFRMPEGLRSGLQTLGLFGVVPIPQSRKRSWQRGHESALSTARHFSWHLEVPLLPLLSLTVPDPLRQTGKNRFDRDFSSQPFKISMDLDFSREWFHELGCRIDQGREVRILLVDDLVTSGSTLSKAAWALKEWLPRVRCWGGSLGYRPVHSGKQEPRLNPDPLLRSP